MSLAPIRSIPGGYRPHLHGLEVFATLTVKAVSVVLIALVAFTLGMTADKLMEMPQLGLMQKEIKGTAQVCRDLANGLNKYPLPRGAAKRK